MDSSVEIIPCPRDRRSVRRFLKLSYAIYGNDPNWVAPLMADLEKVFTDANPLFDHAEMALWIARQDGRDVGRIAGILDRFAPPAAKGPVAFFGFFEAVDDAAVSRRLFATVTEWARQKGAASLQGPMNPTTNDECGLLVNAFTSPPVFMMTYNPEYYVRQFEDEGFRKARDLLAYTLDLKNSSVARFDAIAIKLKRRHSGLTFRPVRRKSLAEDLVKVTEVYNAAWEDNWGFVPMTAREIDFMAARLKPLFVDGLVWLAEDGTEPIGFLFALPDYNIPIKPLRGRLFTPRILGFLPYVLQLKIPSRVRVLTLGVKERYRGRGVESLMLHESLKVGAQLGFVEAEASWILEDNTMMCRMMEAIGGRPYKTYRIYEREI